MLKIKHSKKIAIFGIVAVLALTPFVVGVVGKISQTLSASAAADYNLTLNYNGGSVGSDSERTIHNLSCTESDATCKINIPYTTPTRSGYTFLGYADSASATTAKYSIGDAVTISSSSPSKTIYAVW